jgi:hypothetical protein
MNNSVVIRERIDNIMFTCKMFNNYDMSSMLNVCVKLFSHTHHVLYDDELPQSGFIFGLRKIPLDVVRSSHIIHGVYD